jgi:histone demethylase JARID1
MNARSNKRRRKNKSPFFQSHATNEERVLQQSALQFTTDGNFLSEIPHCPVFYPTIQEMEGSSLDYIEKIRPVAERYGIAKIVPPPGWKPPFGTLRMRTRSVCGCRVRWLA